MIAWNDYLNKLIEVPDVLRRSINIPAAGRRIDIIYNGARW